MKTNLTDPDPCQPKSTWRVALEDAIVVGGFAALTGLIAVGFPPTIEVLYGVGISGGLAALLAWARKRGIEVK